MESRPRNLLKSNRRVIAILVALAIVLVIGSVALALGGIFMGSATTSAVSGYRLPWASGNSWAVTCKGQCPGYDGNHTNQIDFDVFDSTPLDIYAAKPGRVILIKEIQDQSRTGIYEDANMVIIEHASDEYSWYLHLAYNSVPDSIVVGSIVGYNTKIGVAGDTGMVTGVHLHFNVTNIPPSLMGYIFDPGEAPRWPTDPSTQMVPVNFYEKGWDSIQNGQHPISQNGAPGSCNGYDSPGVSLFEHKDCTGRAIILYTPLDQSLVGHPLHDQISSIAVKPGWFLAVYRDAGPTGPSRTLFGNNEFDRVKWDLSSDWYAYPYNNVNMNDSISYLECAICDGAGAASIASADGTQAADVVCPLTQPTTTPPPQPTPTATTQPPPTPTSAPSASWNVKFYSSVDECSQANCSPGSVYHQTSVSGENLDISFSDGRAYGQGTDRWGSIWTQTINFSSGSYVFHSDHDDGVKLFINGINIMDVGGAENNNQTCPARSLSGDIAVTVIWKNTGGSARLKLWWDQNTSACASPVPSAPTNLRQTGSTLNSVSLAWNDNSGNETGFVVYRWNGASFVQFAWPGANVTSLTDTSNVCGTGYFYKVTARNAEGESGESNMLQANTQACPSYPPNNPSNTRVINATENGFGLAWNDNSSDEEGFRIYYWNGTTTELFTIVGPNTTYLWVDKPCGWSGWFYVSAFNQYNNGDFTLISFPLASTLTCSLNPPSNLRINWVTNRSVNLSWDDNSTNELGFKVYRWNGLTGQWEIRAGTFGANNAWWEDSPVNSSTTYFYQVTAYNSSFESTPTPWIEATTHPQVPLIARNLRLTYSAKTFVVIEWDDMSYNEEGFRIERWNGVDMIWETRGTVGQNETVFPDTGLDCSYGYFYRVVSYNVTGGWWSDFIEVPTSPCNAPNPPAYVRQVDATANSITLAWNHATDDETGFHVWRWNGTVGEWQIVGTLGANIGYSLSYFIDEDVTCESGYAYIVSAFSDTGEADSLDWVEAYAGSCIPEDPTNLRQTGSTQDSVTIAWDDISTTEDGFLVYRWNGIDLVWEPWFASGPNVTTFTDSNLNCGWTYFYYVAAYKDGFLNSPITDVPYWVSAIVLDCGGPPVAPPTNLRQTGSTQTSVTIAWDSHPDWTVIYRWDSYRGWDQLGAAYPQNSISFTDESRVCGTTYRYKVSALNDYGESPLSNEISATTMACGQLYQVFLPAVQKSP